MVLRTTWHNIRRSPYQAFTAVFIILQTFFVVSVFAFVVFGSTKIIEYFESLPQIDVFFRNEARKDEINTLKTQLMKSGKIANIRFVSKEEALKIYQEQNKDDPLLLELVTADILPASFHISAVNINDLSAVADSLNKSPIVERVVFPKQVVSKLIEWTDALRKVGLVLVIVLGLDSVLIMIIIIGIKVSHKRQDIEIMRLIGATNWYIRWPFILEGILYGALGGVLGWGVAVGVLWYTTPYLSSFLRDIPVFPIPSIFILQALGVEILLAVVLGATSSFLAVIRYLK
jgi:cell division transport system permease protein